MSGATLRVEAPEFVPRSKGPAPSMLQVDDPPSDLGVFDNVPFTPSCGVCTPSPGGAALRDLKGLKNSAWNGQKLSPDSVLAGVPQGVQQGGTEKRQRPASSRGRRRGYGRNKAKKQAGQEGEGAGGAPAGAAATPMEG